MKGEPKAERIVSRYPDLKTTAVCSAEFLYGAKLSRKRNFYEISEKFLDFFPIIPFDAEAAGIYAEIACRLNGTGRHISTFDELIAAIALRHNEPLITRDEHYREIDGLELILY
ncbi:MAG: type II toxin-antitoxin system VapC family toxin [Methanoregula sp.]